MGTVGRGNMTVKVSRREEVEKGSKERAGG